MNLMSSGFASNYLLVLIALFLCVGCNRGAQTASVTGRVTVGGHPVNRGAVYFVPESSEQAALRPAFGNIERDGTYKMHTDQNNSGVMVGRYRVAIRGRGVSDPEVLPPNRQIHPRFGNPEQSCLSADVKPGGNKLDFNLNL